MQLIFALIHFEKLICVPAKAYQYSEVKIYLDENKDSCLVFLGL